MMDKLAIANDVWENHQLIHKEETSELDNTSGQELLVKEVIHIQGVLQLRWRNGIPWLLDSGDEEVKRQNNSCQPSTYKDV